MHWCMPAATRCNHTPKPSQSSLSRPCCCRSRRPQVVPELQLTPEQLARHNGTEQGKPLLMSVCGRVLDVTPGAPIALLR